MSLSKEEQIRYNRHIILNDFGEEGQLKLKSAKVLVVGAGGLGCPVLQYLTAAGVGIIGIIDYDTVDESNLQRQVLFTVDDVGKSKAKMAAQRLQRLNPNTHFDVHDYKLDTTNALQLFEKYDVVVDGTDNFATRYLVNDACIITDKPLVYGAIFKFEGQVSVFNFENGPSYRCLFPNPPKPGTVPSCSEVGVLGVLPGIIGSYQANEVIKIITGMGEVMSASLLTINILNNQSHTLKMSRVDDEISAVLDRANSFESFDYDYFCTMSTDSKNIRVDQFKQLLKNEIQVLDVRQATEMPKIEEIKAINIPLDQLPQRWNELDKTKPTVVLCQHGVRSLAAIDFLEEVGFSNLYNLKGGIVTWEM